MLLHCVCFLLLLLLPLPLSTFSITKPGCPTHCGNLEIPFPFGLGSNCSIDSPFDIYCNTSTNPPKPYILPIDMLEVVEISGSQIRVKSPVSVWVCYTSGMPTLDDLESPFRYSLSFLSTPYTLSDANELTAFGCDDLARVVVKGGAATAESGGGCLAYCPEADGLNRNGSCPGDGCCHTPLPKGTNFLNVSFSDVHTHWDRSKKLFPCSYAFVGEKMKGSGFTYNKSDYLVNSTASWYDGKVESPLLLEWRIGSENCSIAAKHPSNYACQENSVCKDSDSGAGGYNCYCMQGFEGNPYLSPGCLDINECESNICDQNAICTNAPGSFYCSCTHGYYGDARRNGTGCSRLPQLQSPAIRASIGVSSGMGLLLLISTGFWSRKALDKRKQKQLRQKFFKRNGGLLLQQQEASSATEGRMPVKTRLFSAKELDKATDRFNETRILGQGAQGTVYKGMLSDGQIVAIKKSKLVDEHQLEQFINEVVILSQINHRNVVKLLGCCLETEVPLLVYEFMPNGTLFDHIRDDNTEFPIPWNMRLKIAADVAGALAYLHSATPLPIFHRDIKSSNILLDEKTYGYLDPEYFQSSQFTEKSDVYSFGVVLAELLTGQRPVSGYGTGDERSLATRFLEAMEGNSVGEILDTQVLKQGEELDEVVAVARLAQRCLSLNGKKRPTMREVAIELEIVRFSQRYSSAAGDHGTILGGILGFYCMHRAELKYKEMWNERLRKYEEELNKRKNQEAANEFEDSL
ncbi:UNVERIFIED_CONTAM: Wall-associated receptor kinase-like 8 [Sesamum latifolium]|uniref:Wall-associated receptor kinase-like 8 n=1 Tax=Sesamum latifolium TaxID=2727402 RepID=A0AAW2UDK0_9LAMI